MDGLWQGPNAITQNFQAVVWRIKLMGFNTVRLPFSFQVSLRHALHCYRLRHVPPPEGLTLQQAAAAFESCNDSSGWYG